MGGLSGRLGDILVRLGQRVGDELGPSLLGRAFGAGCARLRGSVSLSLGISLSRFWGRALGAQLGDIIVKMGDGLGLGGPKTQTKRLKARPPPPPRAARTHAL